MNNRLEHKVTSVVVRGVEFFRGQEVEIEPHNIVNVLRKELPKRCPSTIGVVAFIGGVPVLKAVVKCKGISHQTCFYTHELGR